MSLTYSNSESRTTQIAPDLTKTAAKMTVQGKQCGFQNDGDVQTRQAGSLARN